MKTNVAETSRATYHDRTFAPVFATECDRVFAVLRRKPSGMTIKEIAYAIGLPDSTVSGRLNDLLAEHRVTADNPKRKCLINGLMKKVWTPVYTGDPQGSLF